MDARILKKIRQCLALAKQATNEHEAAAAMRQAQNLMRKHKVSESDIDFSYVQHERVETDCKKVVSYHAALLHLIKRVFGVRFVMSSSLFSNSEVAFIGINPQPELAKYCYEVLWSKLKQTRQEYVKQQPKQCKRATKVARGDRFAEGWVFGIARTVEEFALSEKETSIIERYMAQEFPNLSSSSPLKRGQKANTSRAILDGIRAGKKESLHRPVNGQEQQKLNHNLGA